MDLSLLEILIVAAVAVGVLVTIVVMATLVRRRRRDRSEHLRQRFGRTYDRAVDRTGSKRQAEQELAELEERRAGFDLHPLRPGQRDRVRARWEDLQASFVDEPETAVRRADELIDEVASQRGYPNATREQRLLDLSVDHPAEVERYRDAQGELGRGDGPTSTEQLRRTLLASRGLFEVLVGRADPSRATPKPPFSDIVRDDDDQPTPMQRTNGDVAHR